MAVCGGCSGRGTCSLCGGMGYRVGVDKNGDTYTYDCTACNKTGSCGQCGGSGRLPD